VHASLVDSRSSEGFVNAKGLQIDCWPGEVRLNDYWIFVAVFALDYDLADVHVLLFFTPPNRDVPCNYVFVRRILTSIVINNLVQSAHNYNVFTVS
jgi:hypothetical protein